ncbi:MAG: ribonuclease H-like domain-containing protein [archaeon]
MFFGDNILRNTFIHIPGITRNVEKKLWNLEVKDWEMCLARLESLPLSIEAKKQAEILLPKSIEECNNKNHLFFTPLLANNEQWRAYPEFCHNCCFLDIETTGLSKYYNKITTIALYDGNNAKTFVNGINLADFADEISKYSMIVTFNGARFDLPFIKAKFPEIEFSQFHIDLMYAFWKLGERGGLKRIEKRFGLIRDDDIAGVDGFEAVLLWHRYQRGDKAALELLLKYNIEDVKNLKVLLDIIYDRLKEKTLNSSF